MYHRNTLMPHFMNPDFPLPSTSSPSERKTTDLDAPSQRFDAFLSMIGQQMHASPSPLGRFLGGILEHVERGHMRARFEPKESWMNPFGSWHGGTLSAMVDDMIGATVHAMDLEHNFSTVNLHVDFLSWADGTLPITVSTYIVRQGRQMIHAKAELHQQEVLLATASANLLRVGVPLQ